MARAARDAVASLAALETVDQSGAGNRDLRGRLLSLRARGSASSARPRFPGRHPAVRLAAPVQERGRAVEEVTDEPLYRDRVCGIDIG